MTRSQRSAVLVGVVVLLLVAFGVSMALVRPTTVIAGSAAAATRISSSSSSSQPSAPSSSSSAADQGVAPPAPGEPDGVIGAETAGDPYYPDAGNGGYDVQSYLVQLSYDPKARALEATTTIVATVLGDQRLGRFSFDLQEDLEVAAVTVNGTEAGAVQQNRKLQITPTTGVDPGTEMTVVVDYSGRPGLISGGTANLGDGGWYLLDSGGAVAMGEPFAASAWYPVNETPLDRAMFGVQATVPEQFKVISNGLPVDASTLPSPPDGSAVFGWATDKPMASYLTMIYIDSFTQTQSSGVGVPVVNAYGPGAESFQDLGDKTSDYLTFLESKFGPYPFASSGGIYLADSIGFALETQTRPVYPGWVDESTVVHELAHQWFGDDVTVQSWADICLNECFASYAQWLWDEKNGIDLDQQYRSQMKTLVDDPSFWQLPLVDMGSGNEFGDVYSRGPLALHALRAEIGEEKFSELLLSWIEEYGGKNASWSQFEDLVDQVAGKDESAFMDAWFRKTGVPAEAFLWPGDLHP